MESNKSSLLRWTRYVISAVFRLRSLAVTAAKTTVSKLKNLAVQDSTLQALQLILLLLAALSVLVLSQTLLSWDSLESALQKDLSM